MNDRRPIPIDQDTLRVLPAIVSGAAFVAVSQLVGQMATNWFELAVGRPDPAGAAVYGSLGAVVFVLVGAVLYYIGSNRHRRSQSAWAFIGGHVLEVLGLACGFGMVLLSNAFPNWFLPLIDSKASTGDAAWWSIFVCLSLLWCVLYAWIVPQVQEWFQTPFDVAAEVQSRPPPGASTLIVLVSRIEASQVNQSGAGGTWVVTIRGNRYELRFTDLNTDTEKSLAGSGWPWQQLLRSVNWFLREGQVTHLTVILVGSCDVASGTGPLIAGSFSQVEQLCKPMLESYEHLRDKLTVKVWRDPLDFEAFNEVKENIRSIVADLRGQVPDGHIFVDITGGQKIASAAAAAATIGTHGRFLYVRTNPPYHTVVSDLQPSATPLE